MRTGNTPKVAQATGHKGPQRLGRPLPERGVCPSPHLPTDDSSTKVDLKEAYDAEASTL